jgi:putative transposase
MISTPTAPGHAPTHRKIARPDLNGYPRCPRVTCFAERFVLIVRTELTDWMLIFGEQHLRRVLATYAAHYNTSRPHRALQLRPPPQLPVLEPVYGRIRRRPVLGDLINEYEPAA